MANKTNPFMPFIKDFESEAEEFLIRYGYEDALVVPQAIDIRDIVTRYMSLEIIDSENLSSDMSVQGIIAFSKGIVEVYNWTEHAYEGYAVEKPAVFIDADVINEGYINKLLAHEAFHWYKHRQYFVYQNSHNLGNEFAFRCNKKYSATDSESGWSDEEKMEWQARKIAPMILLPRNALIAKVSELSGWKKGDKILDRCSESKLFDDIAAFYHVTPYMVARRLYNLGFCVSEEALHYSVSSKKTGGKIEKTYKQDIRITKEEAFELYRTNGLLREYLNTGMFAYRGIGIFTKIETRALDTADYLTFGERLVPVSDKNASGSIMFHKDQAFEKKKTFSNTPQNLATCDRMMARVTRFSEMHNRQATNSKTANEMLWSYMQDAKWNTSIFQDRTLLSPMDYTRIQRPDYIFKMPAYVAIAVGLGLSLQEFQGVIKQAGLCLKEGDKTDDAYSFILSVMQGQPIDECNDFLENVDVPKLGTHSREKTWNKDSFERG